MALVSPSTLHPQKVRGGREAGSMFLACRVHWRSAAVAHGVSARSLGCGMLCVRAWGSRPLLVRVALRIVP